MWRDWVLLILMLLFLFFSVVALVGAGAVWLTRRLTHYFDLGDATDVE